MEIRSSATTVFSPDVSTGLKDHEVVNEVMSEASVLQMADGMSIAFQEWYPVGRKDVSKKVLALHGWLDNSSSFSLVGPNLASKGFHFVAIDHVGHGESSHIGLDAQYSIPSYVSYVHAVIDQLGWQAPSIVAHSMGAFIGTLFAGCFPERVHKLVLIEGLVPLTAEASLTATNLRKSIESMHRFHLKASKLEGGKVNTAKTYLTFSAAVEARMKSVLMYPGKQTISADAVRSLVSRGAYLVDEVNGDGPVRFRHDPRLTIFSGVSLTDSQVLAVVREITAATLLITGDNGWPMGEHEEAYRSRIQALTDKGLMTHKNLSGSHHLHLDPQSASEVNQEMVAFLV